MLLLTRAGRRVGSRGGIRISWGWKARSWPVPVRAFTNSIELIELNDFELDGLLGFCIIALTIFVPAQSSPMKQRIGVYLWLGLLIVVFSLLMKLFRIKNGGYPFGLLF